MEITDVPVKLIDDGDERLKASCTISIDGEFVIRDVKVIEGTNGLFVAMPSRKLTDHCPKCSSRNHLRSRFCNNCGAKLNENRGARRTGKGGQLHTEIAHPINSACRERLHNSVIAAYERERDRQGRDRDAEAPPTAEREDDSSSDDDSSSEYDDMVSELKSEAAQRRDTPSDDSGDHPASQDSTGLGAVPEEETERRREAPGAEAAPPEDFGAGL
jgi:stage V sporulation protein G